MKYICSFLGRDVIAQRSRLSKNDLVINKVEETDKGTFTCTVDWTSNQHTLTVVSGEYSRSRKTKL